MALEVVTPLERPRQTILGRLMPSVQRIVTALQTDETTHTQTVASLLNTAQKSAYCGFYNGAKEAYLNAYDRAVQTDESAAARQVILNHVGRVAAVQVIESVPVGKQASALCDEAMPYIRQAHRLAEEHTDWPVRFVNASSGALTAALSGSIDFTNILKNEAVNAATNLDDAEINQEIQPWVDLGYRQLVAAAELSVMHEPFESPQADNARTHLVV